MTERTSTKRTRKTRSWPQGVDGLDRRARPDPQAARHQPLRRSLRHAVLPRPHGQATNTVFPWVVSDFGLTDAIESGLVKIPQLARADRTGADDAGVLQHLALDHAEAHSRPNAAASAATRSRRRC